MLGLGAFGAGLIEFEIELGKGFLVIGEIQDGLAALGLDNFQLVGELGDGDFGLLETCGGVMVSVFEFVGPFFGGGPPATGDVELWLERGAALAFLVQLGGEPVAFRAEGADTLVALDEGDGLLGGLMFILPEALLGNP